MEKQEYGILFLRLAIGIVFLWFGIWKFFNPAMWAAWSPSWMNALWPGTINSFMYFQGGIETIIGVLLIIGLFTLWAARLAAIILFAIVIVLGINDVTALGKLSDITVRDLGLFLTALTLCFSDKFHK